MNKTESRLEFWLRFIDVDPTNPAPPGTPPTRTFTNQNIDFHYNSYLLHYSGKFEGPWFLTQLYLSTGIGLVSFLLFSYARTRWPLLFASRTKLKGQ